MKKLIPRFWFTSIIVVVLAMEFLWIGLVTSAGGNPTPSPVTQFLFPVLLVVGTISHFYSRNK